MALNPSKAFKDSGTLRQYLRALCDTGSRANAAQATFALNNAPTESASTDCLVAALKAARRPEVALYCPSVDAELEEALKRQTSLQDVRVVDIDTRTERGRAAFGYQCACFFLQKVRAVHTQAGAVHVGLGGGESVGYMAAGLESALTEEQEWFEEIRADIKLYTLAVGHHQADRGPFDHLEACGKVLNIPGEKRVNLPGPEKFGSIGEARAYRHAHKDIIESIANAVNLVVTSCAVAGDFCVEAMRKRAAGRLPKDFVGEVLLNLFNSEGTPETEHGAAVVSVFEASVNGLPATINKRKSDKSPFVVIGMVGRPHKSRALHAAVCNGKSPWFTDVICTRQVAREVDTALQ